MNTRNEVAQLGGCCLTLSGVGPYTMCHWVNMLKPLALICYTEDLLQQHLIVHMHNKIPLDNPKVSFTFWLSRGKLDKGLNNPLLLFLLILDH
jgi:hypothetical protein